MFHLCVYGYLLACEASLLKFKLHMLKCLYLCLNVDQEAVGNNEPAKRQRRWNSESIKVPEAQTTNSATPTTTPRSTGLKRDFSRSDSSVSEDGLKERVGM